MKDRPLQANLEDEELVIRIGLDTLAFAASYCPDLVDRPGERPAPYCTIADPRELARDVIRVLTAEEEDGTTPLHELLDQAIVAAADDGSLGFGDFTGPRHGKG